MPRVKKLNRDSNPSIGWKTKNAKEQTVWLSQREMAELFDARRD